MKIELKVYPIEILQYGLILLALSFQGSVSYRYNEPQFLILAVVICIPLLVLKKQYRINRKTNFINYYFWIFIILLLLLLSSLINGGSLSISSIGNVFARLLVPFCAYLCDASNFCKRFLKVSVFFAAVSLFGYALQLVFPQLLYVTGSNMAGIFIYNPLFSWNYKIHCFKNVGIYTEPGVYAIVLCSTLCLLLFKSYDCGLEKKSFNRYLIIILAAIVTTQSTTAYVETMAVIMFWLFETRYKTDTRKTKYWLISALILIISFDLLRGSEGLFYKNVVMKMFKMGKLDLSVSTGKSRVVSMLADLEIVKRYPFGAGFTIYQSLWAELLTEHIWDTSSCMGITKCLASYGIPAVTVYLAYLFRRISLRKGRALESISILTIFTFSTATQPQIFYPTLMFLFFIQ